MSYAMLIAFTIVGMLICAACIPLAHLKPEQYCHLLDHDWHAAGPRDWCICQRCGGHEYYDRQFGRLTLPDAFRQWRWRKIGCHLYRLREQLADRVQRVRESLFGCSLCGRRNCDCLPF